MDTRCAWLMYHEKKELMGEAMPILKRKIGCGWTLDYVWPVFPEKSFEIIGGNLTSFKKKGWVRIGISSKRWWNSQSRHNIQR